MKSFSIASFVLTGILLAKGITTTVTPVPELSYSCFMNGTIQLNTTNLNGTFVTYAVGPYKDISSFGKTATDCLVTITDIASRPISTLKNCDLNKPITVYLMKDNSDERTRIIGGKDFHEIYINCKMPAGGVNASVDKIFSVHDVALPTTATKELIPSPLNMAFNSSSAAIGEPLKVTITEATTDIEKYYILPHSCTAASGSGKGKQVDLLQNGKTKDTEVLTDFNVVTTGEANATLYAFRFIDSETVNFECIVTFCETKNCVSGAYNATTAKRRRRAAEEIGHGEKYQVSASFRVVDPEEVQPTSSQSVVRFHPTLTTFLVFLGTVAARRFNRECLF